jgi:uncharacterized protein YuzE
MHITHDANANCAYWTVQEGAAIQNPQIVVEDPRMKSTVVIDLDAEGKIVGIEIVSVD